MSTLAEMPGGGTAPSRRGPAAIPDVAAPRAEREPFSRPLRPGFPVTAPRPSWFSGAAHSPVPSDAPTSTGEPPSGGDAPTRDPARRILPGPRRPRTPGGGEPSASRARSATTRLAPAPVRFAANTLALLLVVVGIHAAASHPLTALATALLLLIAACALPPRR